ncbi:MAG: ATP-binding protein [Bacteroidota bacterium]
MPTIRDLLNEGSEEIVRSHIRKIVEIYDLEWIVVHELVQNAVDAVQANSRIERGEVNVTLDFDAGTVTVEDNGVGFKHDLGLLRPGGTGEEKRLSSRSPAKGYQGVGLKAVMYSTDRFELESQRTDEAWSFLSEGLRGYVDPSQDAVPDYAEECRDVTSRETYTRVTATFPPDTLPRFVSAIGRFHGQDTVKWKSLYRQEAKEQGEEPYEKYLEHFLGWYFRTRSYVGCLNSLLNVPLRDPDTGDLRQMKPVEIRLTMRSSSGFEGLSGEVGGWLAALSKEEFSMTLPYKAWDYAEIALANSERTMKYRSYVDSDIVRIKPNDEDWNRLSVSFRNKFLDLKLTPNEKETDFRERYADLIAILERERSRVKAEDFRDVLEKVTGIYLAIGRTSHFEMLGVENRGLKLIASNGTPTAHELTVRSTSSTWYLETIHFAINVDATLNIGKRHMVNNHLVGRVRAFFEACYPKLVSMSKLFVERDTSGGGEGVPMPDVVRLGQIRREKVPFRRFPEDENTLVGLFSVLMGLLDPEFSVYGFFGKARYDGKFLWVDTAPGSDSDLKLLEFKLRLQHLVDEFELATHDKEFKDLALAVVWDRRVLKPGWTVKGISEPRRTKLENQNVPTHLVEYVIEDLHGDYCPLVCVADLLAKINLKADEKDDVDEYVRSLG